MAKKRSLNEKSTRVDVAKYAASETMGVLDTLASLYGEKYYNEMLYHFISELTDQTLTRALALVDTQDRTDREIEETTLRNFRSLKGAVTTALAEGFSNAMTRFSNQYVDYYCDLKISPPPANTQPC